MGVMKCPYCGEMMENGKIQSNGSAMLFSVKERTFLKMARNGDVQLARGLNSSVSAWHCPSCRKIIIDYASSVAE